MTTRPGGPADAGRPSPGAGRAAESLARGRAGLDRAAAAVESARRSREALADAKRAVAHLEGRLSMVGTDRRTSSPAAEVGLKLLLRDLNAAGRAIRAVPGVRGRWDGTRPDDEFEDLYEYYRAVHNPPSTDPWPASIRAVHRDGYDTARDLVHPLLERPLLRAEVRPILDDPRVDWVAVYLPVLLRAVAGLLPGAAPAAAAGRTPAACYRGSLAEVERTARELPGRFSAAGGERRAHELLDATVAVLRTTMTIAQAVRGVATYARRAERDALAGSLERVHAVQVSAFAELRRASLPGLPDPLKAEFESGVSQLEATLRAFRLQPGGWDRLAEEMDGRLTDFRGRWHPYLTPVGPPKRVRCEGRCLVVDGTAVTADLDDGLLAVAQVLADRYPQPVTFKAICQARPIIDDTNTSRMMGRFKAQLPHHLKKCLVSNSKGYRFDLGEIDRPSG